MPRNPETDERNTPLDPDESEGLIPTHIATQGALNEWEQANILDAEQWAFAHKRRDYLSMDFVFELHRRMFADTWKRAGKTRATQKNIGVGVSEIRSDLLDLLRDTEHWIEHRTYEVDEIAARFHHRLVQIHVFPNGNGRHARLIADVILSNLGRPRFSWGSADLYGKGDARDRYLAALKEADRSNLKPLLAFVRT
jgi:Fic-DOC domain mobile mystery protein B